MALRILSYILLPSETAVTIVAKLSSARTISATFFVTSVPVMPIPIPMSALFIDGASLTPSPVMAVNKEATKPKIAATLILRKAKSRLRSLMRYQQLTPNTKHAPTIQPESTVWKNLFIATGESATAQKSNISLRTVSGLNDMPAGYCIQPLAIKIQSAEREAPIIVNHVEAKWKRLLTFSQPKNMTAMKVDSMKKATIPSMASGAPKMSPTNHE